MSAKRAATSELNRDNWDAKEEKEEAGSFRVASEEEIGKRVIKSAKRRVQPGAEGGKSVFSGFGGFNKTQPKSFDFLANLTNGGKTLNGSSEQKTEVSSTSAFGSSTFMGAAVSGDLTKIKHSSSPNTISIFGSASQSDSKSPFGGAATTTSLFGNTTVSSTSTPKKPVFGIPPVSSSTLKPTGFKFGITTKTDSSPTMSEPSSVKTLGLPNSPTISEQSPDKTPGLPTVTGPKNTNATISNEISLSNSSTNKSPFLTGTAGKTTNSIFGSNATKDSVKQTTGGFNLSKNTNPTQSMFGSKIANESTKQTVGGFSLSNNENKTPPTINTTSNNAKTIEQNQPESDAEKIKSEFYGKLVDLNQAVSEWIKKHVEENPLCILTPIFKDYENYLAEMKEDASGVNLSFDSDTSTTASNKGNESQTDSGKGSMPTTPQPSKSIFKAVTSSSSGLFSAKPLTDQPKSEASIFSLSNNTIKSDNDNSKPTASFTSTFSFGANTKPTETKSNTAPISSPFAFGVKTSTSGNSETPQLGANAINPPPFSFGTGKPFSFSSNTLKKTDEQSEEQKNEEDEDQPPKQEYKPLVEENSVFDIKCKIFVKNDSGYADKGLGTLYIKKVAEGEKHQLLVRANNNLGTILLNIILSKSIPTKRTGKNNVIVVCIPTPDAEPPPVTVLIRVSTAEEADKLQDLLDKHKK